MGPIIYEIAIEIEIISLSYQKCKLYNIPSEIIFFPKIELGLQNCFDPIVP